VLALFASGRTTGLEESEGETNQITIYLFIIVLLLIQEMLLH